MERLKQKDIKIIVDAEKDLLINTLKHKSFLVKPNVFELGEMVGAELKTDDNIIKYEKKLNEIGAKNVLVSMAEEGAVLVSETGDVIKMNAPKGNVIHSVGAGDSMVAEFILLL